eukprot:5008094-Pyramimonas_sp.AAC.1
MARRHHRFAGGHAPQAPGRLSARWAAGMASAPLESRPPARREAMGFPDRPRRRGPLWGRPRPRGRGSRLAAGPAARGRARTGRGSSGRPHRPLEGVRAGGFGDHPGAGHLGRLPAGAPRHGPRALFRRAAIHA